MDRVALGAASALTLCWCAAPVGAATIFATYAGIVVENLADDPFFNGNDGGGEAFTPNDGRAVSEPYDLLNTFRANAPILPVDLTIDAHMQPLDQWAGGDLLGAEVDRLRQAAASTDQSKSDAQTPLHVTP